MKELFYKFLSLRWFALIRKEFNQIKRNKRLVIMLIIPPTMNIILFGFALNPTVTNLQLGVVDENQSVESRELISALTESQSFQVAKYYLSDNELNDDLTAGNLDAGLIIPNDFAKKRLRGETAEVQLIVDAVNSNTATIVGGYASRIINNLNQQILRANPPKVSLQTFAVEQIPRKLPNITPHVALLYNPGLKNSWFIVSGLIGALLVIQGSIVAAASMVKEKEVGTIEQLLMTPAEAIEIITAKIAPIFFLLTMDIFLALFVAKIAFGVPFLGLFVIFLLGGCLCVLSGIGIGTLIATLAKSQQQAQLISFFVMPPLVLLSGVTTPIEAMPKWLQPVTNVNPIRHFGIISRSIMLKGTDFSILYPNFLALATFCIIVVSISMWRFRKQLQ
ncbi:MAG: ABC transporter permease [Pyrinomonadaceae bacterium]|nr:ABC transporter permease [Pyrinomonadaceae bacterium]